MAQPKHYATAARLGNRPAFALARLTPQPEPFPDALARKGLETIERRWPRDAFS
jgi:hypothetical protein